MVELFRTMVYCYLVLRLAKLSTRRQNFLKL